MMSASGTAAKPSDEAEPELRRVTVLFADIAGSTALIQHLDPEAAADLIDPALRAMIDAAERHGGTVSGRGDGVMAIFGAPSEAEDHGLRACLAALAIRDSAASSGVGVRVGIHAGDVVFRPVRIGQSWTQDAVGVAVHIAARLEQTAERGTICLSGAVMRLVRGFVHAMPLDAIEVKGVDQPIERYLLLDADHTANRWGVRAASGLFRFVDRTREMATLSASLDAGAGLRLVQLVGGPGLGKSRLVHEFLATDAAQDCYVVNLYGDFHRRAVPFHPVATWLRGWLDIRADDASAEARRKLLQGIARLGLPTPIDRNALERMLGLGRPANDIGGADEFRTVDFGAMFAALVTAIAARRRTLLVCEDIDSLDAASRELLESALVHLAGQDVLVVTASRARSRLTSAPASAARTLTLAPLPEDDSARLLASIDAKLAGNAALAATILRKAGGNPLFLEEVAPLAAQQNAATTPIRDDDAAIAIPDRVEALIADRLARLPRPLRRLVQLCAVIGIDVPLHLVARLVGEAPDEIYARLTRLQSEQLLYESRKYPDPQFSFKHALTRDVAYRTILAARRRAHHGRIVELLESDTAEAQERDLDDLCFHAIQAQLLPKAVGLLQRAARKAAARSAYQAAEDCLSRAREIIRKLPDDEALAATHLDILMGLQVLGGYANNYAEMGRLLDEAEPLARRLGHENGAIRIQALRVHLYNITGRLREANALGEQASEAARVAGDPNLVVLVGHYLGQSYFNIGRFADAIGVLGRNLGVIADAETQQPAATTTPFNHGTVATVSAMTHGTRAMAHAFRGDHAAAARDIAEASQLAGGSQRSYTKIFASTTEGFCHLQRRCAGDAETAFRAGLALSEADGIQQLTPPLLAGLGHARLLAGDARGAAESLSAAHRTARATGRTMFQISAASGLAFTSLQLGEADLGGRFADEAVALARRFLFRGFLVQALRAQGLLLAAAHETAAQARSALEEALALAGELDMRAEIAHCHAALAVLGADDAAMHCALAGRLYRDVGMSQWFERLQPAFAAGRMWYP